MLDLQKATNRRRSIWLDVKSALAEPGLSQADSTNELNHIQSAIYFRKSSAGLAHTIALMACSTALDRCPQQILEQVLLGDNVGATHAKYIWKYRKPVDRRVMNVHAFGSALTWGVSSSSRKKSLQRKDVLKMLLLEAMQKTCGIGTPSSSVFTGEFEVKKCACHMS